MPSTLQATYSGRRRGRDYVVLQPSSVWGEKAYGLKPGIDDYRFTSAPKPGASVDLVVSDQALRLLRLQLAIRRDRARAPRRRKAPWQR